MLKPLVYSLLIAASFTSCSLSRQASQTETSRSASRQENQTLKFLENISVTPSVANAARSLPEMEPVSRVNEVNIKRFEPGLYILKSIENSNFLQFKYAIMMKVAVEELTNLKLLQYIDDWYSTRYRYGGSSKRGVDCSAFTAGLLNEVFGASVPRTCREQYHATERISRSALQEGDLVFFSIKKGISHVGVYLKNNKFVHASSSHGVMISDLQESYFSRRFVGAGRAIKDVAYNLIP